MDKLIATSPLQRQIEATRPRESNIREEIRFIRTHLDAGTADYCGCWYVDKPEYGISGAAIARADYEYLVKEARRTGDMRLWNLLLEMPAICRSEN